MKTAILYASPHHHNTEKLIKAIAEKHPDITLIDTTKAKMIALANYDLIGMQAESISENSINHFWSSSQKIYR